MATTTTTTTTDTSKATTPQPEKVTLLSKLTPQALLGGALGGGSVIWATVEVMKSEPDKVFRLLSEWGPWFFLTLLCVWVVNGWISSLISTRERADERMSSVLDRLASGQERLADAQERMADAAQLNAEKDNRERERLATLVEYSAQTSREALEGVRALAPTLDKIATQLAELGKKGG